MHVSIQELNLNLVFQTLIRLEINCKVSSHPISFEIVLEVWTLFNSILQSELNQILKLFKFRAINLLYSSFTHFSNFCPYCPFPNILWPSFLIIRVHRLAAYITSRSSSIIKNSSSNISYKIDQYILIFFRKFLFI